ncbi:MAG: hypothetical protein PHU31_06070 [Anaerotignum sp.]|nr:hypothetical protein [Anaerotignum sp.]
MLFQKKKAVDVFSFYAVASDGQLSQVKDKKKLKQAIHDAVCPPMSYSPTELAFSDYTAIIYPWQWNSPTALHLDINDEELSRIWDAIFSYMQKNYDFDDYDAMDNKATTLISRRKDCAVFYFSLKAQ